jgi:hypothetical protein
MASKGVTEKEDRKPASGPRFPSEAPHRHMCLQRGFKGRDQVLKLLESHVRGVPELRIGLRRARLWCCSRASGTGSVTRCNSHCTGHHPPQRGYGCKLLRAATVMCSIFMHRHRTKGQAL